MSILFSFLFVHYFWIVSCVWVRILQSDYSTGMTSNNRSSQISQFQNSSLNQSMYKHFFSILEPQTDLGNCSENIMENVSYNAPMDFQVNFIKNKLSTDLINTNISILAKKHNEIQNNTLQIHRQRKLSTIMDATKIKLKSNNFNSVSEFFRNIQESFLMNAVKSIQYRTKLLISFKKSILAAIGKLTSLVL